VRVYGVGSPVAFELRVKEMAVRLIVYDIMLKKPAITTITIAMVIRPPVAVLYFES